MHIHAVAFSLPFSVCHISSYAQLLQLRIDEPFAAVNDCLNVYRNLSVVRFLENPSYNWSFTLRSVVALFVCIV